MADGLSVILSDPAVKSVFVNVFGGITACDAVADGIVQALDSVRLTKPLVVRLDGNNAARGRAILDDRAHPLLVQQATTMDGAAQPRRRTRQHATAVRRRETMAIFLTKESKVLVQGMTGAEGMKHTRRMLAAGTDVVGGVNPRKAGQDRRLRRPRRARLRLGARRHARRPAPTSRSSSCRPPSPRRRSWRPPTPASDSPSSSPRASPSTTRSPSARTRRSAGTRIIGPNCPGLISPGQSNAGIIPADIAPSRAASAWCPSRARSPTNSCTSCVTSASPPASASAATPSSAPRHIDCLAAFEDDPETELIVMIGEIGGDAEERAAAYIREHVTKPVVGYIAGFTAPEGKTMGHAGAIVSGSSGTAAGEEGSAGGGRGTGRRDADRDGAPRARPAHVTCRISAQRPV